MTDVASDVKFTPPAAALKTVGITVAEIKTMDALWNLINARLATSDNALNQASVGIYIAYERGFNYPAIAGKCGKSVATVERYAIEGMAILRTGESARTTSAIRTGKLSKSKVDELTRGPLELDKVAALEVAVVHEALSKKFVHNTGEAIDVTDLFANEVYEAARDAAIANCVPPTTSNIMEALPQVTEAYSIKRKPTTPATPNPDGGSSTVMHLEFNLKKAVADMQRIALDSEEKYVPTPQDWAAFVALTQFLEIFVPLSDEITASIEALLPY